MKATKATIEKIKEFEGLRLKRYRDSGGTDTIGYGHTGKNLPENITLELANEYLLADIERAERAVLKYDDVYHWNDNELQALTDFAFNTGSIDKLTDNGKRDRQTIGAKILQYVYCKDKILQGLVNRRKWERDLFFTPPATDDSEHYIKDIVRFAYVKMSYRLRSEPNLLNSSILHVVSRDTPCTILGVSGDFYYIEAEGQTCFVFKSGVIYK